MARLSAAKSRAGESTSKVAGSADGEVGAFMEAFMGAFMGGSINGELKIQGATRRW